MLRNDIATKYFIFILEADCMIDAAHDLGVLSADFCKLYHSDRKNLILIF